MKSKGAPRRLGEENTNTEFQYLQLERGSNTSSGMFIFFP